MVTRPSGFPLSTTPLPPTLYQLIALCIALVAFVWSTRSQRTGVSASVVRDQSHGCLVSRCELIRFSGDFRGHGELSLNG